MDSLRELRKEEYQVQHFGISATSYSNEVKEMLMAVMEETIEKMGIAFESKFPDKKEELKKASQKLIEEYAKEVDKLAVTLKEKLNNTFFNIPSFVLLKDDEAQVNQYSNDDVQKIDLDIAKVELELIKGQFMEAKLKQAITQSEKCLSSLLKLKAEYKEESSGLDIFEKILKMMENLSKLKELSTKALGDNDVTKDNVSDDEEEYHLWKDKFITKID